MPDGETIWSSQTAGARKQIASIAPATCAANFHRICTAVLEGLLGIGLNRKKELLQVHSKGLLGTVRAASAVAEAQARGQLHLHILLWLKFGPIFFARFVHTAAGRARLCAFIDATVSATLSAAQHECRKLPVQGMRPYPTESEAGQQGSQPVRISIAALALRGEETVGQTNFHGHRSRCRKGSVGKVKCSQAKPSPRSMATVWDEVKLVPKLDDDDQMLPKSA
jgi:hypothetical protein